MLMATWPQSLATYQVKHELHRVPCSRLSVLSVVGCRFMATSLAYLNADTVILELNTTPTFAPELATPMYWRRIQTTTIFDVGSMKFCTRNTPLFIEWHLQK
jgi:hypothetical protein